MSVDVTAKKRFESNKLKVLADIAKKLNENNVCWGIGASLLLYLKGIVDDFNDIDIMVTVDDAERTKEILSAMGELEPPNPNAQYRTKHFYEFIINGTNVDVMAGFVIVKDGAEYDCSFTTESVIEYKDICGEQIPLQSIDDWRRYYELMGRDEKVRLIDDSRAII